MADRLGDTDPARTRPPGAAVRLDDLSIADVRRHVVVSEPDPRLFTGVLRDAARVGQRQRTRHRPTAPGVGQADRGCRPRPRHRERPRRPRRRRPTASTARSRSAGGPTPAASASGSPWRGPCSPKRPSSSWSSRPARSTPTPRHASPAGSPSTAAAAPPWSRRSARCCSARPTRSCCSRTGSPPPRGTHRELLDHPAYRHIVIARRGGRPVITDHARRTLPIADMAGGLAAHPRARARRTAASWRGCWGCTRSRRSPRWPPRGWSAGSSTSSAATAADTGTVDKIAIGLAVAVVAQTALTWAARRLVVHPRARPCSPSCGSSSSAARSTCRCRRSSGRARATSWPAPPTTSRRCRTWCGSASRRCSSRR